MPKIIGSPVKKKILIVDDDALLRYALICDFFRRGYEVFEAGDGVQALKIIEQQTFDLIISDVKMPKLDGIELLKNIRQARKDIPIFMFITGFAELSLDDAYEKGANALFSKPFDRLTFLKAVEWALLPTAEKLAEHVPGFSTAFEIEVTPLHAPQTLKGYMLNIGRGEIFINMNSPLLPVGKTLEFKILFNHDTPLQLCGQGIVRWIRDHTSLGRSCGCGIEILNFNKDNIPESIRLIETFKSLHMSSEIQK